MPGIAGLILRRELAAPSTARQLIAPITAAGDRIEANAMGHAAFARAEHDLPVSQGGLLKQQSFMVAVSGWVAGIGSRSLAEYCLERYVEQGADGLANLNGTYAVAIWDARDELVVLAQDRLGGAGLCYTDAGGRFGFASRPRALRQLVPPEIDGRALGQVLTIGYPLGDRTLFDGVRLLGPAGLAIWRHGQLHVRRTWSPPAADESPRTTRDEQRAIAAWDAALGAAVADAVADVDAGTRVVLPLSGGLDSRTLLGHARHQVPLHTCSYGHAHARDRRYGARLARIARTTHHAIDLPDDYLERLGPTLIELTDGHASLHAAHLLALGDELRSSPSIVLSGYLGGALIGPHRTTEIHGRAPSGNVDAQGTALFEHAYRVGFDDTALARLLRPEYARLARGAAQDAFLATYREVDGPMARASRVYFDLHQSRFISYQLHALGAAAPVRAPFVDHRVLDQALTWPSAWRDGKQLHLRYLCEFHPDLARVPHTATGIPLAGPSRWLTLLEAVERIRCFTPPRCTRDHFRPHDCRLYAPSDDLIRGAAHRFFVAQLAERSLPEEVFDAGHVASLLQAHLDGRIDAYQQLCAVATVTLWWNRFMRDAVSVVDDADTGIVLAG